MGAREDTDILNGLSVKAVGALLGVNLPASGMGRCPFPDHEDSTPSFEVRNGGCRWICYGCNKRGGAIDLVKTYLGMSFLDAKRWLAEKSGVINRSWNRNARPQTRRITDPAMPQHRQPSEVAESSPDHVLYGALLACAPLQTVGRLYLQDRGLSDDIIERFAIGQMPVTEVIDRLVAEFSFSRVEIAGLLTKASNKYHYQPIFPRGALLFPYLESGRIAYFQARILDGNLKGSRWRNVNRRRRRLYNSDVLADSSIRRVAICEGAIDVLSATQLGCEAIGLIGVTAELSKEEAIALRRRQVGLARI